MNEENENINSEDEEEPEKFSDDPEEQLRIENDLLRLQLQAETGADIHQLSDVPPEVENLFLNNILAFERQLDSMEETTIYEILDRPADFRKEEDLDDEEIEAELQRLEELMKNKGIEVGYGMEYPARLKYKFVTEELFAHETQKFDIPDMVNHFMYEEFHPNHKLAMETLAKDFLGMWLSQSIDRENWEMSEEWTSFDKKKYSKEEVLTKMYHIFDAYPSFENGTFRIDEVFFQESPEGEVIQAAGFVEGMIRYDAEMESGEILEIDNAFTLCMQLVSGSWEIFNADLPGLEL
jgi:hypothetical protein